MEFALVATLGETPAGKSPDEFRSPRQLQNLRQIGVTEGSLVMVHTSTTGFT